MEKACRKRLKMNKEAVLAPDEINDALKAIEVQLTAICESVYGTIESPRARTSYLNDLGEARSKIQSVREDLVGDYALQELR
jgi:hypothetical protein